MKRLALLFVLGACRSPTPSRAIVSEIPDAAPVVVVDAAPPPIDRTAGAWGIAVRGDGAPRSIFFFHGMGASPEDSCSFFEKAAKTRGVLICPREPVDFDAALGQGRTLAAIGDKGILMGFSIGAKTALERSLREKGRWAGLVLMAMPLALDPKALRAAGVRGVVLAAGERDGSFSVLSSRAKQLERAGYPVRLVSLGKEVGHHFGPNMPTIADDALAWLDTLPE